MAIRIGFGQVEPNHLSAQRTSQIYAQLPAADDINVLENGQFVKYDYAADPNGVVDFVGAGEWMMVFNEVKLYEGSIYRESYKDYAMQRQHFTKDHYHITAEDAEGCPSACDPEKREYVKHEGILGQNHNLFDAEDWLHGQMVPRVIKTNVGDIFTTNCIAVGNTNGKVGVEMPDECFEKGAILSPDPATGYLKVGGDEDNMQWQVVKVYTMADGQPAVKLMRIK